MNDITDLGVTLGMIGACCAVVLYFGNWNFSCKFFNMVDFLQLMPLHLCIFGMYPVLPGICAIFGLA